MSFISLLDDICYRQLSYSSQNDFGEWTYSYSSQTNRPITCRISPWTISDGLGLSMGRGETILITGKYDDVRYKCFVSGSLPVSSLAIGDRVIISSNINVYRVKDLIKDSTGFHKTALLSEL